LIVRSNIACVNSQNTEFKVNYMCTFSSCFTDIYPISDQKAVNRLYFDNLMKLLKLSVGKCLCCWPLKFKWL